MDKLITARQTLLLILAIVIVSMNLRPAITSIGPLLEPIREQLELSNAQVSLLTATPVICMGIFAMLAPVLNRKIGLKWTMIFMLCFIGLLTMLRGLISNYIFLVLTAFGVGFAIAIMGPLLSAMIKQYFPQRATAIIGLYSFGMGAGATLSAGLSAYFFEWTNSIPFALSIWSILALFGIAIWTIAMRKDIVVQQTQQSVHKTTSPWKKQKAWLFLLFFGCQSALFFSVMTWVPSIATSASMSLIQAGTLLSTITVIQIVFNITLPLLMERFGTRRFWLTTILIIALVAFGLMWTGSFIGMWVGAVLLGIPLGGLFPIALVLPLDETSTAQETNAWTAMMQTGGFIIGGIVPFLIALVVDYTDNHHYTFFFFTVLVSAMLILALLMGNKPQSVGK